jgi:hypothetical protein
MGGGRAQWDAPVSASSQGPVLVAAFRRTDPPRQQTGSPGEAPTLERRLNPMPKERRPTSAPAVACDRVTTHQPKRADKGLTRETPRTTTYPQKVVASLRLALHAEQAMVPCQLATAARPAAKNRSTGRLRRQRAATRPGSQYACAKCVRSRRSPDDDSVAMSPRLR